MIRIPLVIIALTAIVLLACIYFSKKDTVFEGFNSNEAIGSLSFCPKSTSPYFDKSGDTFCCQGSVQGNTCSGKPVCAMTSAHASLPTCQAFTKTYFEEQGKKFCPFTMPNYFENPTDGSVGCTDDILNSNMSGPNRTSAKKCTVYTDDAQNIKDPNSCYNQKKLADTECFGKTCAKTLRSHGDSGTPPLVMVEFTDLDNHSHTCYSKDSYTNYLNHTKPGWQQNLTQFNPDTNIRICEVAKQVYIDRTMDPKSAQL